ncbi:MAG: hypothetical protein RJB39_581 [Candidatus Parcubacteria bacterium]|jgi:cysteinyl-tRNA synthetase
MLKLHLHNTLSKEIEELQPIHAGEVRMYHCGPTVYDYLHIGNMRTYVFADTLRRVCEHAGYTVKQVINITDVGHLVSDADEGEDKMEKGAERMNKSAQEVAKYFTDIFHQDLAALNIRTTDTLFPKASDHIKEQIALIEELGKRGHTYKTSDGIYFDVSTWKRYGKLGDIDLSGLEAGKRVAHSLEKHTAYDFALWKFSPAGTARQQEWPSPWGVGFPGWHIECSAMSMKYLGETFDIHTGGIDHIPVHHNNEIAQSEAVTEKPLANIWMHGAFLNWKGGKMSKSNGTFLRLQDLQQQYSISPLAYRYFLLQSKYRQPISFDSESLKAAGTAYSRLTEKVARLWSISKTINTPRDLKNELDSVSTLIANDLNTPEVLAFLWDTLKNIEAEPVNETVFMHFIDTVDSLLGLELTKACVELVLPDAIKQLVEERHQAKANQDWARADQLRTEIGEAGYELLDTAEGVKVQKRS